MLIAYYWPPSDAVATHRWLYMAQHLYKIGCDVHVLVPSNAAYASESTEKNPEGLHIVKRPIWEVRRLFLRKGKAPDNIFFEEKNELSFKSRLGLWLRGNVFIPDARVPWYFQIRKFVLNYIKKHEITNLITTGPPHSIHLNGLYIKKRIPIHWVADFRDPWTDIEYHDKMLMGRPAKKLHARLEKKVLKTADRVVTVSPSWAESLQNLSKRTVNVVYNGYEERLFSSHSNAKTNSYTISHIGTLKADRNPTILWKVLQEMPVGFHLNLYGYVSEEVKDSIIQQDLKKHVIFHGNVSHEDAINAMFQANLLLLLVNKDSKNAKGRIPAKIFEYMRSGTPILLLGDTEGDAAKILLANDAGSAFNYNDEKGIAAFLSNRKRMKNKFPENNYTRENQARLFSHLLQDS